MVKGGTGFRKQARKRRIITYQKGGNHHVSSEVDEIADNSIVNIDIVVVADGFWRQYFMTVPLSELSNINFQQFSIF